MSLFPSNRARGSNRGGTGGGVERNSETYQSDKLRRLRRDYDEMEECWRATFLSGLSNWEQKYVTDRRIETPPDA